MNNNLKINRLLKYEFEFEHYPYDGPAEKQTIVATGDSLDFNPEMSAYIVMRTGNPIRYVMDRPKQIVVTPVDEA